MNFCLNNYITPENSSNFKEFWIIFSNWLDEFYRNPSPQLIQDQPSETSCEKVNAFLAASVEHLARKNQMEIPNWVFQPQFRLERPWFPSEMKGDYRLFCLRQSPPEFKFRHIFVTANVLDRV